MRVRLKDGFVAWSAALVVGGGCDFASSTHAMRPAGGELGGASTDDAAECGDDSSDLARGPAFPRMGESVQHLSVQLFTADMNGEEVRARVRNIKELAFGDEDGTPCFFGPRGIAQLAVQTEFSVHEYVASGESVAALDERLAALLDEGVAVHLLLPLHYVEQLGDWQGVDWASASSWSNHSVFAPIQPCAQVWESGEQCPYDVLFEHFHRPVIEHLVETGMADRLAVIYVANEFGYDPLAVRDGPDDWGDAADWRRRRSEALAYTTARALGNARAAADGRVPVGLKLIDVANPNTGWAPPGGVVGDQLAYLLNDVMGPLGDVLGYDVAFDDSGFDSSNRERLVPFLHWFGGGRFALTEFARICSGLPGEFVSGERTRSTDISDGAAAWPSARGINLFSYNTHPLDHLSGCYALTDPYDFEVAFPGAEGTIAGLWSQVEAFTGTTALERCVD